MSEKIEFPSVKEQLEIIERGTSEIIPKEELVKKLEKEYNEKDCFMCNNKVPEEGIVIRKDKLIGCESYKLKSF